MNPRAALLLVLVALAGCGTTSTDRPEVSATLVLDGPPSAAHVGIYVASARGYDAAEGVHLRIRPAATPRTALRRLRSGTAQLAVLDLHSFALARQRGQDLIGIMAIAQLPLANRARAALRAEGRAAIARRLDLRHAPVYPELVLAITLDTLQTEPALARAAATAIQRGYQEELQDPQTALELELARVPRAQRAAISAELPPVEESFTGETGTVGALDRGALQAWAAWEARAGIVRRAPDVDAAFAPQLRG
jgi:ABC-type nitrate/sulfonate/bicarbonate transport system substrate-binding protein